MNAENGDQYFYVWDSDNFIRGDFCFGIKNFDGNDAGSLEPLNQADEINGSPVAGGVGSDNVIANADFVYCFADADYWSPY